MLVLVLLVLLVLGLTGGSPTEVPHLLLNGCLCEEHGDVRLVLRHASLCEELRGVGQQAASVRNGQAVAGCLELHCCAQVLHSGQGIGSRGQGDIGEGLASWRGRGGAGSCSQRKGLPHAAVSVGQQGSLLRGQGRLPGGGGGGQRRRGGCNSSSCCCPSHCCMPRAMGAGIVPALDDLAGKLPHALNLRCWCQLQEDMVQQG